MVKTQCKPGHKRHRRSRPERAMPQLVKTAVPARHRATPAPDSIDLFSINAVVEAGLSVRNVAFALDVPPSTLTEWLEGEWGDEVPADPRLVAKLQQLTLIMMRRQDADYLPAETRLWWNSALPELKNERPCERFHVSPEEVLQSIRPRIQTVRIQSERPGAKLPGWTRLPRVDRVPMKV